jgi:hypothetical protein
MSAYYVPWIHAFVTLRSCRGACCCMTMLDASFVVHMVYPQYNEYTDFERALYIMCPGKITPVFTFPSMSYDGVISAFVSRAESLVDI